MVFEKTSLQKIINQIYIKIKKIDHNISSNTEIVLFTKCFSFRLSRRLSKQNPCIFLFGKNGEKKNLVKPTFII